jgi:heme-degrading monooxygenase HmoA
VPAARHDRARRSATAVYTVGLWKVKPGEEDAFIAAWRDLANATANEHADTTAVLLRDRETPNHFVSAGPWESLEEIEAWRASTTFTSGVGEIRPHLETFEPHTMDRSSRSADKT